MLPEGPSRRLSVGYDAEQQTGDYGCSDLLSASQRRVSSEDGRRCVALVMQHSQAAWSSCRVLRAGSFALLKLL